MNDIPRRVDFYLHISSKTFIQMFAIQHFLHKKPSEVLSGYRQRVETEGMFTVKTLTCFIYSENKHVLISNSFI